MCTQSKLKSKSRSKSKLIGRQVEWVEGKGGDEDDRKMEETHEGSGTGRECGAPARVW